MSFYAVMQCGRSLFHECRHRPALTSSRFSKFNQYIQFEDRKLKASTDQFRELRIFHYSFLLAPTFLIKEWIAKSQNIRVFLTYCCDGIVTKKYITLLLFANLSMLNCKILYWRYFINLTGGFVWDPLHNVSQENSVQILCLVL